MLRKDVNTQKLVVIRITIQYWLQETFYFDD